MAGVRCATEEREVSTEIVGLRCVTETGGERSNIETVGVRCVTEVTEMEGERSADMVGAETVGVRCVTEMEGERSAAEMVGVRCVIEMDGERSAEMVGVRRCTVGGVGVSSVEETEEGVCMEGVGVRRWVEGVEGTGWPRISGDGVMLGDAVKGDGAKADDLVVGVTEDSVGLDIDVERVGSVQLTESTEATSDDGAPEIEADVLELALGAEVDEEAIVLVLDGDVNSGSPDKEDNRLETTEAGLPGLLEPDVGLGSMISLGFTEGRGLGIVGIVEGSSEMLGLRALGLADLALGARELGARELGARVLGGLVLGALVLGALVLGGLVLASLVLALIFPHLHSALP